MRKKTKRNNNLRCTQDWSRPWRASKDTPEDVAQFLKKTGLVDYIRSAEYRASILQRFGETARAYLAARNDPQGYIAKAASLDLALAVNSQCFARRYEAYLSWFTATDISAPSRILDIGCDIGVQACYYAERFPQAQVVGIDRCEESVACARELAVRLGLANVTFRHADVLHLPEDIRTQTFDLVTSTFVMHESGGSLLTPTRCIEEALSRPADANTMAYARTVAGLLGASGTLISFERLSFARQFASWTSALHQNGIGIAKDDVEFLTFADSTADDVRDFPVFRASSCCLDTLSPDDIRDLWAPYSPFTGEFKDAMAEAAFRALQPATLLKGFRWMLRDGPHEVRYEVWRCDALAFSYFYSPTHGLLIIAPRTEAPMMVECADPREALSLSPSALRYVEEYDSPEDAGGHPPASCTGTDTPAPMPENDCVLV